MKLTIAIPTLPERQSQFHALYTKLLAQSAKLPVEIIWNAALKGDMSIGAKRQALADVAKGEYLVMIDDDDNVHTHFVERVLSALSSLPDCVCYYEAVKFNGMVLRSIHSNDFDDWGERAMHDGQMWDYVRTPFYKDVIRTDIVRSVGIADSRYAEDIDFARRLKASGLIQTEVMIKDFMYIYNAPQSMNEQERKQRYGIIE